MGALHLGHLSLIQRLKQQCDRVVVSIYVNEKQFGASEDLATYPRQPEKDQEMARNAGADHVWIARSEEVYPPDFSIALTITGPDKASKLWIAPFSSVGLRPLWLGYWD